MLRQKEVTWRAEPWQDAAETPLKEDWGSKA
jgi:hypothetical protein